MKAAASEIWEILIKANPTAGAHSTIAAEKKGFNLFHIEHHKNAGIGLINLW